MGFKINNWGWTGGAPTPPPTDDDWLLDGNTEGAEKYIGTNDAYNFPVVVNGFLNSTFTTDGRLIVSSALPSAPHQNIAIYTDTVISNQIGIAARIATNTANNYAANGVVGDKSDSLFLLRYASATVGSLYGLTRADGSYVVSTTSNGLSIVASNDSKIIQWCNKVITTADGTTGFFAINKTAAPTAQLDVQGNTTSGSGYGLKVWDGAGTPVLNFYIADDAVVSSRLGYWINGVKVFYLPNSGFNNVAVGLSVMNSTMSGSSNFGFGSSVLTALTTGNNNIGIGMDVLTSNLTGGNNIGIGTNVLKATTGSNNSGFGYNVLAANIGGIQNVGMGTSVLELATSANNNVGVGFSALSSVGVGGNNTSIGTQSLSTLTSGTSNVSIGSQSGIGCITGTGNTYLGYASTTSSSATNFSIALGYGAITTASSQWVVGDVTAPINTSFLGRGVSTVVASLGTFSLSITGVNAGITDGSAAASIFYWDGAVGTGTGVGGSLIGRIAIAGSTASTRNALVEKFRIDGATGFIGVNQPSPVKQFSVLGESRFEPVSGVAEDITGATVNTTDATANVTAQTIAIASGTVASLETTIVYRKTGGAGVGTTGDGTVIKLNSSVKNVAGTLTLDIVQNTYSGTTNAIAGVSATYTVSGTNILVSVTGVVNDNITWNAVTHFSKV